MHKLYKYVRKKFNIFVIEKSKLYINYYIYTYKLKNKIQIK